MKGILAKILLKEIIVVLVPGIAIYLFSVTFLKAPNDLGKTLFTASAPTIAILVTATAFIYKEYSEQVDQADQDARESVGSDNTDLDHISSDLFFPKLLSNILIRCLILILITSAVSAMNYFGSNMYGIFIASTSLILFIINLAYLIFKVMYRFFIKIIKAEDVIKKKKKEPKKASSSTATDNITAYTMIGIIVFSFCIFVYSLLSCS